MNARASARAPDATHGVRTPGTCLAARQRSAAGASAVKPTRHISYRLSERRSSGPKVATQQMITARAWASIFTLLSAVAPAAAGANANKPNLMFILAE